MKNKISALLVLAIFIISLVPLAIADEVGLEVDANLDAGASLDTAGASSDTEASLDAGASLSTEAPARDKMRKRAELRHIQIAEKLDNRIADARQDLLANHRARLNALAEKCKINGLSTEACKVKFEKRMNGLEKLPEVFKARLVEFESRAAVREKAIAALKEDKDFKNFRKDKGFKIRKLAALNKEKARQRYIDARFNYAQAKIRLEKAKDRLEKAKGLEKACKDPNSEECKNAKAELLASAKEHFSNQADMIIEMLQKLKAKLTANEDISDEDETKLTVDIDAKISNITAIKAKINAAQNKEELLAAAKELKHEWGTLKRTAHRYASFIVSSRMAGVIVKASHLEKRLERILGLMAEKGQDVTEVQPLVDEFHTHITEAKASFKAAQSIWLSVKLDVGDAEISDAQAKLKDAREHLRKANDILQQIFKKLDKGLLKEAEEEDDLDVSADENDSAEDDDSQGNSTNATN